MKIRIIKIRIRMKIRMKMKIKKLKKNWKNKKLLIHPKKDKINYFEYILNFLFISYFSNMSCATRIFTIEVC